MLSDFGIDDKRLLLLLFNWLLALGAATFCQYLALRVDLLLLLDIVRLLGYFGLLGSFRIL